MKKLVTMLAAIVLAVSAQAIQLNWGVTAVMTDSTGAVLANKTVALVMAASTATTASDITYNYNGSTWSIGGGTLVNVSTLGADGKSGFVPNLVGEGGAGAWGVDNYVGVDFAGNATTALSQGTGGTKATRYYMIVFDTDYTSGKYAVASPVGNTTVSTPTSNGTTVFGSATGPSSTWTAVPEPTSMALLAIGVAALGLRRKFRA